MRRSKFNSFAKIVLGSFASVGYMLATNLKKDLFVKFLMVLNFNLTIITYQLAYRFPLNMRYILEEDPTYFKEYMQK